MLSLLSAPAAAHTTVLPTPNAFFYSKKANFVHLTPDLLQHVPEVRALHVTTPELSVARVADTRCCFLHLSVSHVALCLFDLSDAELLLLVWMASSRSRMACTTMRK